jgi:Enoyl-(Acyl carrier protein) reductase
MSFIDDIARTSVDPARRSMTQTSRSRPSRCARGGGPATPGPATGAAACRPSRSWPVWRKSFSASVSAASSSNRQPCCAGTGTSSPSATCPHGRPGRPAVPKGTTALILRLAKRTRTGATVRVNCVVPGWVDTPFNDHYWARVGRGPETRPALERHIPVGRQGAPDEIASVIAFVLSPEANYLTGQTTIVDGGLLAGPF